MPVTVWRAIPSPVLHSRKLCEATWEKSTFLTWIKAWLCPLMVDLSFTNSNSISVWVFVFFFFSVCFWQVTGKLGHVHSCFSQLKVRRGWVVFPNHNDRITSVSGSSYSQLVIPFCPPYCLQMSHYVSLLTFSSGSDDKFLEMLREQLASGSFGGRASVVHWAWVLGCGFGKTANQG